MYHYLPGIAASVSRPNSTEKRLNSLKKIITFIYGVPVFVCVHVFLCTCVCHGMYMESG